MPKPRQRFTPNALQIVAIAIQRTGSEDPHVVALALFEATQELGEIREWKVTKPSKIYKRIEESGIHVVSDVSKVIELIHKPKEETEDAD